MLILKRALLVVALAAAATACRQADGPIPSPSAEQSNEIGDIARDLLNVAAKDRQAPEELRNDLVKYGRNRDEEQRIGELATSVVQALDGARVPPETAQTVAKQLWVGLSCRELSERQVKTLREDVNRALASTGVPEQRAQAIGDRLSAVQQAITQNPRRWYQVF